MATLSNSTSRTLWRSAISRTRAFKTRMRGPARAVSPVTGMGSVQDITKQPNDVVHAGHYGRQIWTKRERRLKLRPPYLRRALSSNGQIGITQVGALNGNRFGKAIRIPPRLALFVVVVQPFRLAIA